MANKKSNKTVKTKKHLAREQREAKQIRLIIIIAIVIGVAILGLVGYGAVNNFIIRPRTQVAKVGDTVINVREFEKRVKYTRIQMLSQAQQYYDFYQQLGEYGQSFLSTAQSIASQLTQPVVLGSDVLDQMIDGILIKEEAEKRGITVTDEEIDEAIQAAFGYYPGGTPTPTQTATIASTPTYSETQLALVTLTSTPTNTQSPTDTPEVTATSLEETESEEDVQTQENDQNSDTEENIVEEEVELEDTPTPELTPTITQTPTITLTPTPYTTELYGDNLKDFNDLYSIYDFDIEDLREIFKVQLLTEKLQEEITKDLEPKKDEVWARHILVETQEEAQEVLDLLDQGEDFNDLAATYSTDESNSGQGGDLGWFDRETMVPEFTEAAFSLDVGEISEPVETTYGFHIIQVLGKRENQMPQDEFIQEKQTVFNDWLSEKRNERTDIVIFDEWEAFVPDTPEISAQFLNQLYPTAVPTDVQ